jgi:tetratricopeptide (TPR) repeat protein
MDRTGFGAAGGPASRLWQAPLFVLGVAALAAVTLTRPLLGQKNLRVLADNLSLLRHTLSRSDGDLATASRLASQVLEAVGDVPDRAGEIHFLYGSTCLRLGERQPEQAAEHWRLARQHLEEAEQLGVPEADRGRLLYRLAKVGFHTHDDPRRVVQHFEASVEQADDKIEAYTLLTQAYLRLPQPNLTAALESNRKLRQLPEAKEDVLSPAKLLGGELLLRLNKPEEARRTLELVSPQGPPGVLAQARLLRARSWQEQERWDEAIALWLAALNDKRDPPQDAGPILYNLGVCYDRTKQPAAAVPMWEECVRTAKGDEAGAAALALANLRLADPDPEKALEMFAAAVQKIQKPADWTNTLLDLPQARDLFEKAARAYRQAGKFGPALELASHYQRIAVPGKAAVMRAEASLDWGRARQEESRRATTPEAQQSADEAARNLFCQAGDAYADAAGQTTLAAEQAEYVWQSAAGYLAGRDHARGSQQLERFLKLDPRPERKGEGWYLLAEAHRQVKNQTAALAAYRECIKFVTPFAYKARYQLALEAMASGDLDDAESMLELNLQLLRNDPDAESQEKSLFALGNLFFQRRNYRMVVRRLEEALGRFPANPEATRAHFQLAESYRMLAALENQALVTNEYKTDDAKAHAAKERDRWLRKAAQEYLDLAAFLNTPEAQGHLTPEEQVQVPLTAAECRFNLGEYNEALKIYSDLASRYAGRLEALNALGGMVRCHAALGQQAEVRQRLDDIRRALAAQDDPAVRQQWEEWVTIASKPPSNP